MRLAFQLAYRNLTGAGLRTWLNSIVLSFAFVLIIFFNGMMDGWDQQAKRDTIAWEYGKGQLWNENYDPFDPFTLQDGHGEIPEQLTQFEPIFIQQSSIYPSGRQIGVALKGMDPEQKALSIPVDALKSSAADFPAVVGKRMAESAKLSVGDEVLLRWRDKNGTFDASTITIVDIFDSNVASIDMGQLYIALDKMWEITGFQNHASLFVASEPLKGAAPEGWVFKTQKDLTKTLDDIISSKKYNSSILYLLLLAIALLAIFDTQVLSIFRRQKEIGTYIALGMTRWMVVGLFTVEGAMYSLFAMILGCVYGIPLFIYMAAHGIAMPKASQEMGVTLAEKIFPVYGVQLILSTILVVVVSATIVSFLPTRKITKMDPVAALKGKLQ